MALSGFKNVLVVLCTLAALNVNADEPSAKSSVLVIDLFDSLDFAGTIGRIANSRLRANSESAKWTYLHATSNDELRERVKVLADSLDEDEKFTHVIFGGHGLGAHWLGIFTIAGLTFSPSDQEAFDILKPLHAKMSSNIRILAESCLILKGSPEYAIEKAKWLAHALGVESFELFGHQFTDRPSLLLMPIPNSLDNYREIAHLLTSFTIAGGTSALAIGGITRLVKMVVQFRTNAIVDAGTSPSGGILKRALPIVGPFYALATYLFGMYGAFEPDDVQQIGYLVNVENGTETVKTMRAYDYFWFEFLR